MKYWLSHLPLEVWVDCYRYPGISREQLGQIVDLIGNHSYGEYLQFYLHDWGKRTLGPIHFSQQKHRNPNVDYQRPFKAIPLTPLPSNIKSFECIQIRHFDQQTIDFLQHIRPLLLAADTKFIIFGIEPWNVDTLRAILDNIVPLLGRIDELRCGVSALPTVQQCFGEELTKINILKAFDLKYEGMGEAMQQETINFFMTWLAPAQQAGIAGPKEGIIVMRRDNGFSEQICTSIREDFLAAKSPSTYALTVYPLHSQWEFAEFHLQNGIGEELHGVKIDDQEFQIARHRANCGTKMEEWIKGIKAKRSNDHFQDQFINIQTPTIGQIDAMDGPDDVEENEEKQSTAKQA